MESENPQIGCGSRFRDDLRLDFGDGTISAGHGGEGTAVQGDTQEPLGDRIQEDQSFNQL